MLGVIPILAFLLLAHLSHARRETSHPIVRPARVVAQADPRIVHRKILSMSTSPQPLNLSFSGTTGTLTWTTISPPVVPVIVTTVVVSGGGDSPSNGNYVQCTGGNATYNGAIQYTNGTHYIAYASGTTWGIFVALGASGVPVYYSYAGTPTGVPSSGWVVAGGHTPVPVVSGTFGSSQGLTITGLSGGAVTISSVATTSTTTTFTISRSISSTETGETFYSAAGDFSDSATTANFTTAFSIPITASMFGVVAVRRRPPIYF